MVTSDAPTPDEPALRDSSSVGNDVRKAQTGLRPLTRAWSRGATLVRLSLTAPEEIDVDINFYTIVLYKIRTTFGRTAVGWGCAGIAVAILQLISLFGIMLGSAYRPCLYTDDCSLGHVCVREFAARHSTCYDCGIFDPRTNSWLYRWALDYSDTPVGGIKGDSATDAGVPTVMEFCNATLQSASMQGWRSPPTDFSRCLFVQEMNQRSTNFDQIVIFSAFLFLAVSTAGDFHQQLVNHYLRLALFPRRLSWRSSLFKLIEIVLSYGVRPFVALAMLFLLATTSFNGQDALLNGLSVTFVLAIDDELPSVVVSSTERAAIMKRATEDAKAALPFESMRWQTLGSFGLSLTTLVFGWIIVLNSACQQGLDDCFLFTICFGAAGGGFIFFGIEYATLERKKLGPKEMAVRLAWVLGQSASVAILLWCLYVFAAITYFF
jgi:hypothetical protein